MGISESAAQSTRRGVFYSDAPDGYRALVVYLHGRRILRLEIADDYFSSPWTSWLERWLSRQSGASESLTLLP